MHVIGSKLVSSKSDHFRSNSHLSQLGYSLISLEKCLQCCVGRGRTVVDHIAALKPGWTTCPSGACVHQKEFVGDPKWNTVKGTTFYSYFKSKNVDFSIAKRA